MKKIFYFFLICQLIIFFVSCGKKNIKPPTLSPDILYDEALKLYNKGKYEKAAKKFLEFKNRYPFDSRVLEVEIKYCDSLYKDEEYVEAENAYLEFIKLHPKNKLVPYAYYQLGMIQFNQISTIDRDKSKLLGAMRYFTDLIKKYPDSKFAIVANHRISECRRKIAKNNFYIGYFYFKQQRYDAAIYRFKKILNKYPGFIDDKALYYLAKSYMNKNKLIKAKRYFIEVVEKFPKSKYYWRAKRYLKHLNPEKFSIWARIKEYYFMDEEDVGDKYITPGYKQKVFAPETDIAKFFNLGEKQRTLVTLSSSPELKKEYEKVEKESEEKSKENPIPVNITSNQVTYLEKGKKVLFTGNVVGTRGDFVIKADKLLAFLDKNKQKVNKIEMTGNVILLYMSKEARCKKAIYVVSQDKVILEGNPAIKEGKNLITGNKIVYFLKTQQVFVMGSKKKRSHLTIIPNQ